MLRYCRYFKVLFLVSSSIIFLSIFIVSNNFYNSRNIVPAGFIKIKTTPVVFLKPNMATKSMKEIFEISGLSDHVVFFNRIPKSGAELFLLLLQNIKEVNAFLHVRLKGIGNVLDINEQRLVHLSQHNTTWAVQTPYRIWAGVPIILKHIDLSAYELRVSTFQFKIKKKTKKEIKIGREIIKTKRSIVSEVREKIRQEAVPMIFDRNIHFLNFTKFGEQSPTFINFVRNPIDIILSRLQYFIKEKFNGEEFDLNLCIINSYYMCKLNNPSDNYFVIPYFCGHDDICMSNSKKSLNQAKRNVEKYFSVVGILEELNTTLEVFDNKLPYFFKGAQRFYERNLLGKIPKNAPIIVSNQAQAIIRDEISLEYEFYTWLKDRLFQQIKIIYGDHVMH